MSSRSRRLRVSHLLALVAGMAVLALVIKEIFLSPGDPMGKGSPQEAQRWKSAFVAIDTPGQAQTRVPGVFVKPFADGSWVFGVARGSHGDADGGTIVVKDSTGAIRAFFGHVCDPSPTTMMTQTPDDALASFYRGLLAAKYTEYSYP